MVKKFSKKVLIINPFFLNASFLCPLKTLRFSDFSGVDKCALGTIGLNIFAKSSIIDAWQGPKHPSE